jgi:hypothetical protein
MPAVAVIIPGPDLASRLNNIKFGKPFRLVDWQVPFYKAARPGTDWAG